MASLDLDISQITRSIDQVSNQLVGMDNQLKAISKKGLSIKVTGDFKNTSDLINNISSKISTLTKKQHKIDIKLGSTKEITEQLDKISKDKALKLKIDNNAVKDIKDKLSKSLSDVKLGFSVTKTSIRNLKKEIENAIGNININTGGSGKGAKGKRNANGNGGSRFELRQDFEAADVTKYFKAFVNRDMSPKEFGAAIALVESKYGQQGIKLLNDSISKASYNDATYGREAREFLNETKALRHSGLGGKGSLGDLGFMSAIRHGNIGYYLTDALMGNIESTLKSHKMNSLIRNSRTFKNFIDDYNDANPNNKINISNKKESKKFLKDLSKNDKKQYTKLLAGTIHEDSTAGTQIAKSGAAAGIIGAAVAGITLLGKKIVELTKECISAAQNVETLKTQLSVVYGSTAEANNSFGKIEEYAKKSPFGVETMTQQAILLKQSGVYGYDLMNTLGRLGDISSGNAEKMRSVSEVYARVLSATTVTARDMRQLANAGVPAYKALTSAINKYGATNPELQGKTISQSQIRSLLQGGKITSQDFRNMIRELTDEGGLFEGAVEKGAKTLAARKQNLEDKKEMAKAAYGAWATGLYQSDVDKSYYKKVLDYLENINETTEKYFNDKNDDTAIKAFYQTSKAVETLDKKIKEAEEKGDVLSMLRYTEARDKLVKNAPAEYDNKISAEYRKINEVLSDSRVISKEQADILAKGDFYERRRRLNEDYEDYKENRWKYMESGAGDTWILSGRNEERNFLNSIFTKDSIHKELRTRENTKDFYKGWSEVSLLEKMTNAFEKFSDVVEDLSSVQQREQKALQEWEKSPFVTRERQIEGFNRDVELRRTIDSYDNKYRNKDGSYNFLKGESLSEYNKVIESVAALGTVEKIDTGINDVFDVKTGKLKVKLDENGNNILVSNLEHLSKNMEEVASVYENSISNEDYRGKYGDISASLLALQVYSKMLAESTNDIESYRDTIVLFNEAIDDLTNNVNKSKDKGDLTKEEADAIIKSVSNAQTKKVYDTTNKKYLGERTSYRLWQNTMASNFGLDQFWLREMAGNRSTNAASFWNKYYKDNISKKSIYSSLATSLLGTGRSYGDIAGALVKTGNGSYDTTLYDWNASISNLKNMALSGKSEEVDAFSKSLDGVIKQLDKMAVDGAATTEAWGDLMSASGALGSAMDMTVKKLSDGSVKFTNATMDMIANYRKELASEKLSAEITSAIKKPIEDLVNDTKNQQLRGFIASGGAGARLQSFTADPSKYRAEVEKTVTNVQSKIKSYDKDALGLYFATLSEKTQEKILSLIGKKLDKDALSESSTTLKNGAYSLYGKNTQAELRNGNTEWKDVDNVIRNDIYHLDTIFKMKGYDAALEMAQKMGYSQIRYSNSGDVFGVERNKGKDDKGEKRVANKIKLEDSDVTALQGLNENGSELVTTIMEQEGYYSSLENAVNQNTEALNAQNKALEATTIFEDALKRYDIVRGYDSGLPKDTTLKSRGNDYSSSTIWNTPAEKAILRRAGFSENLNINEYWDTLREKLETGLSNAIKNQDKENTQKTLESNDNIYKRIFSNLDFVKSKNISRSLSWISGVTLNPSYEKSETVKKNLGNIRNSVLNEDGSVRENLDYDTISSSLLELEKVGYNLSQIDPFKNFKDTAFLDELNANLEDYIKNTKEAFKQVPSQVLLTATNQLGKNMYNLAHNAKTTEEANQEMASAMKSVASSLASQIAQLNTQLGMELAISGAKMLADKETRTAGIAYLAAGLSMAGVGGVASFASGYMEASAADNKADNEAEERLKRLENLKTNLADLLKQARDDATYYEQELRSKSSLARNEAISVTKVNDMILTPKGAFSTSPQDYIIATKKPNELGGGGFNASVNVSIVNQSGANLNVTRREQSKDSNGNLDIKLYVNSVVSEGIASGEYDNAFNAMRYRQQGDVVSA